MPVLEFRKVEGLGNDFLLIDRRRGRDDHEFAALQAQATQLCDRRTGVGADGLLFVGPPTMTGSQASMLVINFDGSRPEMCGNGLRCVAQLVAGGSASTVRIDTDAGQRLCTVGDDGSVEVDMGPAKDLGVGRPAAGGGRPFRAVSMGNPHAVTFVGDGEDPEALARALGPGLEVDPAYRHRTNVEFARLDAPDAITLWVWERGCGITQACGTGACATAAAALYEGHVEPDRALVLSLPGGDLRVTVPRDPRNGVLMRGPARQVFIGRIMV